MSFSEVNLILLPDWIRVCEHVCMCAHSAGPCLYVCVCVCVLYVCGVLHNWYGSLVINSYMRGLRNLYKFSEEESTLNVY